MESQQPAIIKKIMDFKLDLPRFFGNGKASLLSNGENKFLEFFFEVPKNQEKVNSQIIQILNIWKTSKAHWIFKYSDHQNLNSDQKFISYKVHFESPGKIKKITNQYVKWDKDLINEIMKTCLDACIFFREKNIRSVITEGNMFLVEKYGLKTVKLFPIIDPRFDMF